MAASTSPNIASVTSLYGTTVGFALDTTVTTDLITVSANKILRITTLLVANIDGTNSATVNVDLYRGSTAYHLAKTITVAADSTLDLLSNSIYLEEDDALRLTASANSDLEAVCSYEDIS